jgi:hypothetical protein
MGTRCKYCINGVIKPCRTAFGIFVNLNVAHLNRAWSIET